MFWYILYFVLKYMRYIKLMNKMDWLKKIWEVEIDGGNSTVQVLWGKCFKLYPEKNGDTYRWVSKSQLEKYHNFQSSLWEFFIDLDEPILWCNKIKLIFLDISKNPIYEWCDIKTREKIHISEVDFIQWCDVWKNIHFLLDAIRRYFQNQETCMKEVAEQIYSQNIKVTSIERETWEIHIICTDVFWNIPWTVERILCKK